jgi:transcriptional regulator NrdR family protein
MNIIRCPECNSFEFEVYETKGCIEEGALIEETECLNCNHLFTVKAKLLNIEILGAQDA